MHIANKLKFFVYLFFAAILSCLAFQIRPSQAADDETQKKSDINNNTIMCLEEEKRPIEMKLTIPPAARGHEEIYRRFLNGVVIYRRQPGSDVGKIELRIRDLADPLEGTFDLSRCGDTEKYLSISTGYRKGKKCENKSKVEVWIAPKFLIERELATMAAHFRGIMDKWGESAQVGLFWNWGGSDHMDWYDHLTVRSMDEISEHSLYKNWWSAWPQPLPSTCATTLNTYQPTARQWEDFYFLF